MALLLISADFAKSYVAAHTRTLPNGKVVQVSAFSDKRYKQALRDVHTPDMFKPELPAPKNKIPDECARHPERCTPDLFTGKTAKEPSAAREFKDKINTLTEVKADGVSMQSRCRDVRAWVSHQKTHGAITEADYDKWIGMVNEIHDENKPVVPAKQAPVATKTEAPNKPNPSAVSGELAKMGREYYPTIPVSQALAMAAKHGLHGIDDDGSPWEGMLTGRDGRTTIELANAAGKVVNAMAMQWHKMDSGKYEFNAYLTGTPMHKSEARIVFFKSHVKQFTRGDGTIVKEHDDKRTKKMVQAGPGRKPAAPPDDGAPKPDAEDIRGSAHGYGTHNIEEGDALKFKAGDFEGGGKVKSVGQDGVTVTDASGRDHGVHWHEVSGRGGKADGGGKEPPVDDAKPVADAPEPPEKNEPVEAKEPAADKPSNVVGIKDKKTGVDDFARALFDTSELAKLPGKVDQPKELDSWEKISEKAPEALEQFTAKLKQVSDALGLEQGRIPSSFDMAQEEENSKAKKEDRQPKTLSEEKYMSPALWNNPRGFLFIGPLKKHDRALAKVVADYTDKETGDQDWHKLKDVVRATIAVPSVAQIPKVLAEMGKAGIKLAQKPKNNLTGDGLFGSGYRDLNLIVQMPNGMMCELQIHCKPITEAKEHGHQHYAENAAIERQYPGGRDDMDKWSEEHKAKYKENHGKMKSMYDAAWEKSLSSNDSGEKDLHKALAGRTIILWKRGPK